MYCKANIGAIIKTQGHYNEDTFHKPLPCTYEDSSLVYGGGECVNKTVAKFILNLFALDTI